MTKPIKLNELIVTNPSFLFNQRFFHDEQFGFHPYVINFKTSKYSELNDFLADFKVYLDKRGVNPRFPYPIYIKTEVVIKDSPFALIKSIEDIDKYFPTKKIRHTNREISYLQKIKILRRKINNQHVSKAMSYLLKNRKKRKKLFNLCLENDYYKRLINSLTE